MSRNSLLLLAFLAALALVAVRAERTQVVFDQDSRAGRIRVVERPDGLRELYIGSSRGRQTALYVDRPGHLELPYTRVAMAALAWLPPEGRVLFVGLGGGAMPNFTRHLFPRARIDAVELEPRVVDVAREWFGFREDSLMKAHVADGRVFIEQAETGSWDVIILDAFSDGDVPLPLATSEFLEAVRRALRPGGVVAGNLHTVSPRYESMVATYQAVFPEVGVVQVPGRRQRIVLAGRSVPEWSAGPDEILPRVRSLVEERELGFDLETIVEGGYARADVQDAPILRDPPR